MPPETSAGNVRQEGIGVNITRLLDWKIPDVRHRYTARDTALYALSVGVGHEPMDPRQLELVDPWNPRLQSLPTMALVLGYPGFWLGEPAVREVTGIDASRVLHAEQAIELHAPLPAAADVTGRTRVTALVDKGAGRGALLYSERVIQLADSGQPLATCRQVHFLRGCGGFGGTGTALPAHSIPAGAPTASVDLSTRPEQALLYRLNGDANALHFSPQAALKAGLARPIFHGMGTMGVVAHALLGSLFGYEPQRVRSLSLRMTAPVYPGDTLRTETWPDGSFRTRALERDTVVIDNGLATSN